MMFIRDEDRAGQREIADQLERAWDVQVQMFGDATAVDAVALRRDSGQMVAAIELKWRTHAIATYPTVFLSFRKWCMLMLAASALGVVPLYVVRFADALAYVDVRRVRGTPRLAGRTDRGVGNDLEPIIEVPVDMMRRVNGGSS